MRKFLKDGTEFRGLEKTVVAILKSHYDGRKNKDGRIKIKQAAATINKVYRLSEDYDSDESSSDEENAWLLKRKAISKKLKKMQSEDIAIDGKYIKLAKY